VPLILPPEPHFCKAFPYISLQELKIIQLQNSVAGKDLQSFLGKAGFGLLEVMVFVRLFGVIIHDTGASMCGGYNVQRRIYDPPN